MTEPIFDFGFTLVDESELNTYQQAAEATAQVEATTLVATATQEKVDAISITRFSLFLIISSKTRKRNISFGHLVFKRSSNLRPTYKVSTLNNNTKKKDKL